MSAPGPKLAFCPFYAHALHFHGVAAVLIPNPQSNQCALITTAHSPCMMEIRSTTPDWRVCRRNPEVREREPQGYGSTEARR
jgi:hypothetical protein